MPQACPTGIRGLRRLGVTLRGEEAAPDPFADLRDFPELSFDGIGAPAKYLIKASQEADWAKRLATQGLVVDGG